jgi:hypothetical protein
MLEVVQLWQTKARPRLPNPQLSTLSILRDSRTTFLLVHINCKKGFHCGIAVPEPHFKKKQKRRHCIVFGNEIGLPGINQRCGSWSFVWLDFWQSLVLGQLLLVFSLLWLALVGVVLLLTCFQGLLVLWGFDAHASFPDKGICVLTEGKWKDRKDG